MNGVPAPGLVSTSPGFPVMTIGRVCGTESYIAPIRQYTFASKCFKTSKIDST